MNSSFEIIKSNLNKDKITINEVINQILSNFKLKKFNKLKLNI